MIVTLEQNTHRPYPSTRMAASLHHRSTELFFFIYVYMAAYMCIYMFWATRGQL